MTTWDKIHNHLGFDARPAATWWTQYQSSSPSYKPLQTIMTLMAYREIWIGKNHATLRGIPYHPPMIADRTIKSLCATLAALKEKRRLPLTDCLRRHYGLDIHSFGWRGFFPYLPSSFYFVWVSLYVIWRIMCLFSSFFFFFGHSFFMLGLHL